MIKSHLNLSSGLQSIVIVPRPAIKGDKIYDWVQHNKTALTPQSQHFNTASFKPVHIFLKAMTEKDRYIIFKSEQTTSVLYFIQDRNNKANFTNTTCILVCHKRMQTHSPALYWQPYRHSTVTHHTYYHGHHYTD